MKPIATCLMFVGDQCGKAEEAIQLYIDVFDDSKILDIVRHQGSDIDADDTILTGSFILNGTKFQAMDSAHGHEFTFTPAISLSVECESAEEFDRACTMLVKDGKELMAPGDYGFSRKFGWVEDRYGVSWQLNLP